ncbi:hypothetical protein XH89_15770 [Bradyrhizobium sp. CCBAU 53340]|uniref:hypothetical protein n=1 Tax=Bradyrhizobium sp. CCBAU 53340 TaxID=1325112 RepID=UPI00188BE2E9|nr:hypothetical protein [Bradyrhizobium sp. CCBAU 53340]QOZ44770.1 hypothetical protein XH89_15770 [Bradyrhizobium sp. CCBAU 53340]
MNRPNLTPAELARYKAMFALRRLGSTLQSDVLADGAVARESGIGISNPVHLPDGVSLDRNSLFDAFQKATDGEAIPSLKDTDGAERSLKLEIQNGNGVLSYGTNRIAFPQAALLSKKIDTRQALLTGALKGNTLTQHAAEQLNAIVSKPDYSQTDFFAARKILGGAPESFATGLHEVARNKGELSQDDLLPSEPSHWENLAAAHRASQQLADFVSCELAAERSRRISQDPIAAIDTISLSFGSSEMVPFELMRTIHTDDLLSSLRALIELSDPVALTGAFELCADRAADDQRLIEMGSALLDRLLNDPARLLRELETFATAFVIATAHLAEHEDFRTKPVFWRRVVAAAHASLVARVLGSSPDDKSSLLNWAIRIRGKAYYLSIVHDAYTGARWRADWITPDHVAADLYGRLLGALQKMGDAVPEVWRDKIKSAERSILKDSLPLAQSFPSLLQGAAPSAERPPIATDVGRMYAEFISEPTLEKFLYFIPIVYAFGFSADARNAVLSTIQMLRENLSTTPPEMAQAALGLAAMIAAQNRDVEIADTVTMVAVERVAFDQGVDVLLWTVTTLVECAAARTDRKEALAALARRLENLAFVAPTKFLEEAVDALRILQSLDRELAVWLGRAIATARLGLSSSAN